MNTECRKVLGSLTPYPELDTVLINHANHLKGVLGDTFIGYYLQGSLAIGDFDLTSDIDFVVITTSDLTEEQVEIVKEVHNKTYTLGNRWVKRLEYSFIPIETLKAHSSPFNETGQPNKDNKKFWYFDNGHKEIEQSDHCNTLVTRWTLWERGIAVLGPDIKTLTYPIDVNDLRREIKNTIIGWADEILINPEPINNRFYQSYLVLNYSRMLHNLIEGMVDSKAKGIVWAKQNLDTKWTPLIDFCWE